MDGCPLKIQPKIPSTRRVRATRMKLEQTCAENKPLKKKSKKNPKAFLHEDIEKTCDPGQSSERKTTTEMIIVTILPKNSRVYNCNQANAVLKVGL